MLTWFGAWWLTSTNWFFKNKCNVWNCTRCILATTSNNYEDLGIVWENRFENFLTKDLLPRKSYLPLQIIIWRVKYLYSRMDGMLWRISKELHMLKTRSSLFWWFMEYQNSCTVKTGTRYCVLTIQILIICRKNCDRIIRASCTKNCWYAFIHFFHDFALLFSFFCSSILVA